MVCEGGKGTWGKEGSEIQGATAVRDEQDPNYDSEDVCIFIIPLIINTKITHHMHIIYNNFKSHHIMYYRMVLIITRTDMCLPAPPLLMCSKWVLKAYWMSILSVV